MLCPPPPTIRKRFARCWTTKTILATTVGQWYTAVLIASGPSGWRQRLASVTGDLPSFGSSGLWSLRTETECAAKELAPEQFRNPTRRAARAEKDCGRASRCRERCGQAKMRLRETAKARDTLRYHGNDAHCVSKGSKLHLRMMLLNRSSKTAGPGSDDESTRKLRQPSSPQSWLAVALHWGFPHQDRIWGQAVRH